MDALMALGWVLTHLGRSRRKHHNVANLTSAISRIRARFELAQVAAGSPGKFPNEPLFAKHLLQVAALCVRTVVDLALQHEALTPMPDGECATDPWKLSATDGINTHATPLRFAPTTAVSGEPGARPDWAGGPSVDVHTLAREEATGAALDPESNSPN